jgi:hypothetical protein
MEQLKQQLQYKEAVLQCANICGGVTGQYMDVLCPDKDTLRTLLESGRLRKVPVSVKGKDGEYRKITIYELPHYTSKRRSLELKACSAVDICYMNDFYIKNKDQVSRWLDGDDIESIANAKGLKGDWNIPRMMYYVGDELCGVLISKKERPLRDERKQEISKNFALDKCIEILIP